MTILPFYDEESQPGNFSPDFIHSLARELVYRKVIGYVDIDGKEWEKILAECLGVLWTSTNTPLIDVLDIPTGWSSKTVIGKLSDTSVKLISGRNSISYEFGETVDVNTDPTHVGDMVLSIWNNRVQLAKSLYKYVKVAVLIRNKQLNEFALFQKDISTYESVDFRWVWNERGNLYGSLRGETKFIWQPHGSQFSIFEQVPSNTTRLVLKDVRQVSKERILEQLGFDTSSYGVLHG